VSRKKNRQKETFSRNTEKKTETLIDSTTCIVMGYDGEPKVLYVHSEEVGGLLVKPTAGEYDRPLCLPIDSVFTYDAELFSRLVRAYQSGETDQLNQLWTGATKWKAPNRAA